MGLPGLSEFVHQFDSARVSLRREKDDIRVIHGFRQHEHKNHKDNKHKKSEHNI
jgi:hypothetical protein